MNGRLVRAAVPTAVVAALLLAGATPALAGSVKRVDYRANDYDGSGAARVFFNEGGLKLRGECQGGDDLNVIARTATSNAAIHYNAQYAGAGASYAEEDDFDKGESEDILGNLGADDDASGQIIYSRPGGVNVTVDWLAERSEAYGDATDCAFVGTARVLGRRSRDSLNFRGDVGDEKTLFLERGGLKISVNCGGAGELNVLAGSTANGGVIRVNSQSAGNVNANGGNNNTNSGLQQNLFSVMLGDIALNDSSSGQIVFSHTDGTNVSVDWMAEDSTTGDGFEALGKDCVFTGTIRVRPNAHPRSLGFRFDGSLPESSFFAAGGLQLLAACDGSDQDIFARSGVDNSTLHYNGQAASAGAEGAANNLNPDPDQQESVDDEVSDDASSGQLVYSTPAGTMVSADYLAEDGANSLFGMADCSFIGTAEVAAP